MSAGAMRQRVATTALGLALPAAVAAIWQVAVNYNVIDSAIWASPVLVAQAFVTQVQDPQFWSDFGASLLRDMEGTILGIAVGLPTGLALGVSRILKDLFAPVLDAAKAIPIFTWVPFISVWLGSGEAGKITFIALAASLPVIFNTMEGVFSLEPRHTELGRLLRLNRFMRLRRVIIPGASPAILRGVHLAFLYGWLATIGAEYLFEAGSGIGTNIMGARELFRLDLVVVDIIAIGILGAVLDIGLTRGEHYLLRWKDQAKS